MYAERTIHSLRVTNPVRSSEDTCKQADTSLHTSRSHWELQTGYRGCELFHLDEDGQGLLVSAQFPEGPPRDPLCELNCFNQAPMWPPTKDPGPNHRLLFCFGGSQRGRITSAGRRFICFGVCFIPGDSEGSGFPG
ncbi:hypothetical protein KUCAC02_035698 [Chaenocephalus aceratus]|nr:hypothetical protein KUCAC02_035698 [Chaenocephalus aceratus]